MKGIVYCNFQIGLTFFRDVPDNVRYVLPADTAVGQATVAFVEAMGWRKIVFSSVLHPNRLPVSIWAVFLNYFALPFTVTKQYCRNIALIQTLQCTRSLRFLILDT